MSINVSAGRRRVAGNNSRLFDLEEDLWREKAACSNRPYHWFEREDEYDGSNEGLAEVLENLGRGIEVCSTCPVKLQCLRDATPGDLAHTVRGGQWPTSVSKKSRGRPRHEHPDMPRVFGGRKRDLTPDEVRVGNIYLSNRDRCEGVDRHVVLALEHLTFKRNGVYVKARCRACVQDDNLEHKRRSRGTIDS